MKAPPAPVNPPFDFAQDGIAGVGRGRHVVQMTGKDQAREERLAAALRENLRKRKAQARAQEQKGQKDSGGG